MKEMDEFCITDEHRQISLRRFMYVVRRKEGSVTKKSRRLSVDGKRSR